MRVLLFSGGIDSSALAAWKRPDIALTINYGHRPAKGELIAAAAIAAELKIRHEVLDINLSTFGVGPLAGKRPSQIARAPEWWPYRNQMLITAAGMRFVPQGLKQIIIGAVSTDVHADGKLKFIKGIDALMRQQEGNVRVVAPAISMTAEQLLRRSKFPLELIGLTFSCHVMEHACGKCRGCLKHSGAMRNALSGKNK